MSTEPNDRSNERESVGAVESAEEILPRPATRDDLSAVLADRPRRGGLGTSTGVLIAIVVLAVGFLAGLLIGRSTASSSGTGNLAGTFPSTFPSGAPGAAAGNGSGDVTVGTVTRVDGDTVYVKTANGKTVKVVTDSDTQIQVSTEGTTADLSKGSTVLVQGSSSGGAVKATRITEGDLGGAVFGPAQSSSSSGG